MKPSVGFIGTGVMGKAMAAHLLEAGYPMTVYTRTKRKAQELLDMGATWSDSVASLAQKSQVVITMVGFPLDVEQVYFAPYSILANASRGSICIDMTTSSPQLAERIYNEARDRGIEALDAPVSGGEPAKAMNKSPACARRESVPTR